MLQVRTDGEAVVERAGMIVYTVCRMAVSGDLFTKQKRAKKKAGKRERRACRCASSRAPAAQNGNHGWTSAIAHCQ